MNSTAMAEQIGKYWGWTRSSSTTSPIIPSWASPYSSEPSWEEQAFARDAAAHLGGCVWPPRSYSCSFCQREFRSAQALGGHMNVHRRDRALLRQGSSPDDGQEAPVEKPQQRPFFSRASPDPSTTVPPPSYLASTIKESKNKQVFMTMRVEDTDQYDDVELRRMKRRRLDPPLPIFVQTTVSSLVAAQEVDHDAKVPKEIISNPSSIPPLVDQQEVDLELRLGTSPKVT